MDKNKIIDRFEKVGIWFEAFSVREKCDKCMKNKADYLLIVNPRGNPTVSVMCCNECIETLPKEKVDMPHISVWKNYRN